ncbi:hypothetical protein [Bradyrhizobium sp. th.b2]|uniref:hypothetical protein n=1 Tax=Bradyrhizobium sp. th-b2 TaxID=172088 RepID=UPI001FDA82C7|nr:hypothetical protein [Bradyrhizobium sp. th.b2]
MIADEAVHSMNAVNVIRAHYSDRIGEVAAILDNLIRRVTDKLNYSGTFVLDHFGGVYNREMFASSRLAVMRNVAKPIAV